MNIAILCNTGSSRPSARMELIKELSKEGNSVFIFGVRESVINEYYFKHTAGFISIVASRNNTNPFLEMKSLFSVKKQIRAKKIDSVIIYGVKNHAAMAIGAKLGGAKKILCVVNGRGNLFRIGGMKGKFVRFMAFPMLKIAYSLCTSICFQNVDDKALFKKKHLIGNNKKVFVTGGSGVNLETFSHKTLPSEDRFLFLARITPSKGIKEYIGAARIVKKQYPNVMFDVVGPMDEKVEKFDKELLMDACRAGIVAYHGMTEDVVSWIGSCRFFIYPSYYPEGVPRCAIQAIAIGRPIITCATPGCRETVRDGVNGFMVPAKDEKILAEKMIWMIEHPVEVEAMAIESRQYAEEKFDVNKINEMIKINLLK